jgi:D-isomer specific 2-hydroxyacid dehydrogenase, NAD binding domain
VCDVVTINAPLHPETEHLFNDELLGKMKCGAYLVTRRAAGSAIAMPWSAPCGAGDWLATQVTFGIFSRPLRIIRGERCRITA